MERGNPTLVGSCRRCFACATDVRRLVRKVAGMKARRIFGLALVIVAIGVAIALHSSADSTVKPGDVNDSRIDADIATGTNWLVNGRTLDSKHFSPSKP